MTALMTALTLFFLVLICHLTVSGTCGTSIITEMSLSLSVVFLLAMLHVQFSYFKCLVRIMEHKRQTICLSSYGNLNNHKLIVY